VWHARGTSRVMEVSFDSFDSLAKHFKLQFVGLFDCNPSPSVGLFSYVSQVARLKDERLGQDLEIWRAMS